MIRIITATETTLILGFIIFRPLLSELLYASECSWFASVVLFEGSQAPFQEQETASNASHTSTTAGLHD
jgi:hypothetical protein